MKKYKKLFLALVVASVILSTQIVQVLAGDVDDPYKNCIIIKPLEQIELKAF